MRLSQKVFQFWGVVTVLGLIGQAALAAPPVMRFRAPMFSAESKRFEIPQYIGRPEEAVEKRLERMQNMINEFRGQDRDMMSAFSSRASEYKMDPAKATELAKKFEDLTRRIEEVMKGPDKAKAYAEATKLLAERENLYDSFLKDSAARGSEFHVQPGNMKELGQWPGMLTLGEKGATGVARTAGEPEVANTTVHGDTARVNTTANAGREKGLGNLWGTFSARSGCSSGFCAKLQGELGGGAAAIAITGKVTKALEKFESSGNMKAAEDFVAKLRDVTEAIGKLPARSETRSNLVEVLGHILATKGITASTFEELEGFVKGGDVDALQGFHRMANVLGKLRKAYEEKQAAPKEGTPEYDAWVAKRDAWVGERLNDWVEYGEAFRQSVAGGKGSKGAEGFAKWVRGEHEHEANGRDKALRPEAALAGAFCSNCGGWMRLACKSGGV